MTDTMAAMIAMPGTLETVLDNLAVMSRIRTTIPTTSLGIIAATITTAGTIGTVQADIAAMKTTTSMGVVSTAAETATTNTAARDILILMAVVTPITIIRQSAALVENAMSAKVNLCTTIFAEIQVLIPATKKNHLAIATARLPLRATPPAVPNKIQASIMTLLPPDLLGRCPKDSE